MASNVRASKQPGKHLRQVAIVAFLGLLGAAAASSCAEGGEVNTTTGAPTGSGSGGMGGAGGAGGGTGGVGMGGSGGSGGMMCVPEKELCDGKDNDCDGVVDNGCDCKTGDTQACYSGPDGTKDVGTCVGGTQTCDDLGQWGPCDGEVLPTETELCDGKDTDCDGLADVPDEGCSCVAGVKEACYTGPDGTKDVGTCKGGERTCADDGTWGPCEGEVVPAAAEVCDGYDDDCDGQVDPPPCVCVTGQTQDCYTGPMGTKGVGLCKAGTQTCDEMGQWGACMGDTVPTAEMCDGLDNDCDGAIDQGNPGGGGACVAPGLGECKKGTQNCVNGAIKCTPAPVQPEVCDGLDNNCDGNTDEGNPGGGMQCMTGLLGLCSTGLTQCDGVNGVICKPNVVPGQITESCNSIDDDCDGMVDDAIPQVGMQCTKAGQVGICQFGTYECPMGAQQLFCNAPLPGTVQETCNAKDDDCNGTIDDPALLNGLPCNTGYPGVCSTGTTQCVGGSSTCNATVSPGSQTEICDNKDNNCNGSTDEMQPNPACTAQNPNAQFVSNWACTAGACAITQCQVGYADIDGAPGNGCECTTDAYANACANAGTVSVAKGGTVNMIGKIESAMGSDWLTFSFVAPAALGTAYAPKIVLASDAGGQYAMDVMTDCMTTATCNDNGTGTGATTWEMAYAYNQAGNPKGAWSDATPKITAVKVRVYRKNGTPPTCDQYTVTATNP